MSIGWILFWAIEGAIAVYLISQHFANKRPTSMDVAMGDEIGNALLILLGFVLGLIAFAVYLWHHFRLIP